MPDVREQIILRLMAIAETLKSAGIVSVERNLDGIHEDRRPAILIVDADEEVVDDDVAGARSRMSSAPSRPPLVPYRVSMTPEIYILLGEVSENVGAALNHWRARLLLAILNDATTGPLRDLVGTNGGVRYHGASTSLSRERTMEGELGLSLSFTYTLNPAHLADV